MPSSGPLRPETPRSEVRSTLGLALSGGGSRAAAFHRGTVQGLSDIGLLDEIDVVSSVSGGSVFAAAWMAARWKERSFAEFIDEVGHELAKGFIQRSISLCVPRFA
jgi:NTE family protein